VNFVLNLFQLLIANKKKCSLFDVHEINERIEIGYVCLSVSVHVTQFDTARRIF
jgi:hypothetical protein